MLLYEIINLYFRTFKLSLIYNASFLMLNNISTSLLGFIFWNIMARSFSSSEVGMGTALVSVSAFLAFLANLGFETGIVRFMSEANSTRLMNSVYTYSGITALILSIIYVIGISFWSPPLLFIKTSIWLYLSFIMFTVATTISHLIDQSMIAGRSSYQVFLKNSIISIIKIPLPIYVFGHIDNYAIFAGTGTATFIGVIISLFWLLPSIFAKYIPYPIVTDSTIKKILPYSLSNYLASLLSCTPIYIYPLMIINVLGPEESAYFYIAWMMSSVISIVPLGIAQSFFAEGSHNPRELAQNGRRALIFALFFLIPIISLMLLTDSWLLSFFGTQYAENSKIVFRYLAFSAFPMSLNIIFIVINQVKKRLDLIICQTSFFSLTSIGLGYVMLLRYGLIGIGLSYLISHLIVSLVIATPLWRTVNLFEKDNL